MPAIAQRRTRHLPSRRTIDLIGMVASIAAMVVMVPVFAVDGDFDLQRACVH